MKNDMFDLGLSRVDFIEMPEDPTILTMVETCCKCSAELARHDVDLMDPDTLDEVVQEVAHSCLTVLQHWREAHVVNA